MDPLDAFLDKRAISQDIGGCGRYIRYEKGDDLSMYYVGFPDEKKLQAHARRVAGQCGGFLIIRCGWGSPSPPQLRPDEPVYLDRQSRASYHPDDPYERVAATGEHLLDPFTGKRKLRRVWHQYKRPRKNKRTGEQEKGRWVYALPLVPGRERHIANRHGGENVEQKHMQPPDAAKYVLPPGPHGRRLDVPDLESILAAETVFFGIEGSPKIDAIRSQGEAAFGVPSVGQWDAGTKTDASGKRIGAFAAELNAFIEATKLQSKTLVAIVPDSDWCNNAHVITQAMLARQHLRGQGVRAIVAAPPWRHAARNEDDKQKECKCAASLANEDGYCRDCGGFFKGVDDFLRAGGSLDEMDVVLREVIGDLDALLALFHFQRRRDAWTRSARALRTLPLFATVDGEMFKSVTMCARILGCSRDTASKAIVDLQKAGAIEVEEGSLDAALQWPPENPMHDLDWVERPRIRFAPEFCYLDVTVALGEFRARPEMRVRLEREVGVLCPTRP